MHPLGCGWVGIFQNACLMRTIGASCTRFTIGSHERDAELPIHTVMIERPFAVGRFEVTFDEWEACVADNGCISNRNPDDRGWGKGRRPVINVSWGDAKNYVDWLSRRSGKTYRLLTEAEWEYAARAGSHDKYTWGNEIGKNRANCDGCGSQWDKKHTAPVGSFQRNAFGLHDMHGNVREWVADCYANHTPLDGNAAPEAGGCSRVVRGGGWSDVPSNLRSASRTMHRPEFRVHDVGTRVARTLD